MALTRRPKAKPDTAPSRNVSAAPGPLTVGLISLGCAKNLVDSEMMAGTLLRDGLQLVNDPAQADALIVNTCSFIDAAQEESVDAILQCAKARPSRRPSQSLIVAGCLAQRFRAQLPSLLPEVDAFMGIDQVPDVSAIVHQAFARRQQRRAAAIESPAAATAVARGAVPALAGDLSPLVQVHPRPSYLPTCTTPRFRLTPRHHAYLKIAEGCNHPCSFCTIPRIRGRHRSRPQADVIQEARTLLDQGVRELNLIAQDSTGYGLDLGPKHRGSPANEPAICTLLRALDTLPGEFWIRLLYTHPARWTDSLIQTIAECPKVARYVDIPLQHIHDDLLARMRRETSSAFLADLLHRIRAGVPGIALRTTFIVGFPGETDAHFERLLEFVREVKFDRVGVFTYSQEEGTAASRLPHQVPDRVKRERRDALMAAQQQVSRAAAHALLGKTLRVLVEGPGTPPPRSRIARLEGASAPRPQPRAATIATVPNEIFSIARSEADAPDIDGRVYVQGMRPAGEFAQVRVVGHTDYDLIAQ